MNNKSLISKDDPATDLEKREKNARGERTESDYLIKRKMYGKNRRLCQVRLQLGKRKRIIT